jgi:hypothetical protein
MPFDALGVHVFPQKMNLPGAGSAVDEVGHPSGDRRQQLQNLLSAFSGREHTVAWRGVSCLVFARDSFRLDHALTSP